MQPVPGIGTVVSAGPREPALNQERIVAVAIAIADAEGLDALSMRRLAAQLGVGAMSLYRHVSGRDELTHLMLGSVFDQSDLPEPKSDDWRAELERIARAQWRIYREHPWTARLISFTRPVLVRSAMAQTERGLQALDPLGLDITTMIWAVGTLSAFVCGMGLSRAAELEEAENTGVTSQEWMAAQDDDLAEILSSGRFPQLARLDECDDDVNDLDVWFEFGLQRHLDGLAAHFLSRTAPR